MKDNLIKKIQKEEKGSVTLFVLASCMFFLMITLLININIVVKNDNQKKQIAQIIENYKVSAESLQEAYDNLYQETQIHVALKNGTLCFYDNEKEAKQNAEQYYGNIKNEVYNRTYSNGPNTPWYGDRAQIKKVEFCTEIRPLNMACYFSDLSSLTEIAGLENLHTDQVTSMKALFYNCTSLPTIDVSKFKTYQVTSMDAMFYNCASITNIIGLANLDTSKVTNMNSMFSSCKKLTTIDISTFNLNNIEEMGYMFSSSTNLQSIKFPENMDTRKLTFMREMFTYCSKLTTVDVSKFNTENVTDMKRIFRNCLSLSKIDIKNWNTSKVLDMNYMFEKCSVLKELDLSNFNTQNVTDMSYMFRGCSGLTELDVSNFNTQNVTDMSSMFEGCSGLTELNVSNFNTQNVTAMPYMFYGCTKLKVVNCNEFTIKEGANAGDMFNNCTSITELNINKMDLSKAGSADWAFAKVPNTAKITTNKAMKTWIETVYNPKSYANFTNIQTID